VAAAKSGLLALEGNKHIEVDSTLTSNGEHSPHLVSVARITLVLILRAPDDIGELPNSRHPMRLCR
jgi:hypothetical protein